MRRREFTVGLLLAVTVRPTSAQHREKYRIAFAHQSTPVAELPSGSPGYRAFLDELHKRGYLEGLNLLIVAVGGPLIQHLQSMTATIPIVGAMGNPVAYGFAESLAQPGRNITGISPDTGPEIWGKRLALLKEAVPSLSRAGLLTPRSVLGNRRIKRSGKQPSDWAYRLLAHRWMRWSQMRSTTVSSRRCRKSVWMQ